MDTLTAQAQQIKTELREIASQTAALFRGEAFTEEICSVPPLKNDETLVTRMAGFLGEIFDPKQLSSLKTAAWDRRIFP